MQTTNKLDRAERTEGLFLGFMALIVATAFAFLAIMLFASIFAGVSGPAGALCLFGTWGAAEMAWAFVKLGVDAIDTSVEAESK